MTETVPPEDENDVYLLRKQKLVKLQTQGFNFPNHFKRDSLALDLIHSYNDQDKASLEQQGLIVAVAGRIMLRRLMGRASFCHIEDSSGRIQIYLRENDMPADYDAFKGWDLGDIIGVEGQLFKTNSGELSVHATKIMLLTKSLKPLPDKFHGLCDLEICYRKRYLDLIANDTTKRVFLMRSKLIKTLREFMDSHQFLEVETPMMHPIPGGAQAKPFVTHYHALDKQMYLRISPELYLKRLVVGGFERVYEINRSFRNEGLSSRHNPEFTMIEFYQAYADYQDLMVFTEALLHYLCDTLLGTRTVDYQNTTIDFSKPFAKLTVQQAIISYHSTITAEHIASQVACQAVCEQLGLSYEAHHGIDKLQMTIFEETVEQQLIQPTFITHYPTVVSPLARRCDDNPSQTERFEFFIAGREIANGFSELNDAQDQAARFYQQVKEKEAGDTEAMHFDADYIEALEYGLPPTAGQGIGIDRLVMLFTNAAAIRDVILFPHLR